MRLSDQQEQAYGQGNLDLAKLDQSVLTHAFWNPITNLIVAGVEAQTTVVPDVLAVGGAIDLTSQDGVPQVDAHFAALPFSTTTGFAAGATVGVRTSEAKPGDVTGSLTLTIGVGLQVGLNKGEGDLVPHITDVRLFMGFGLKETVNGNRKADIAPSLNIHLPATGTPPPSIAVLKDALPRPPQPPPAPTVRCQTGTRC